MDLLFDGLYLDWDHTHVIFRLILSSADVEMPILFGFRPLKLFCGDPQLYSAADDSEIGL